MRDDGDSSIKMFLIDNQGSYLRTFEVDMTTRFAKIRKVEKKRVNSESELRELN